MTVHDAVKVLKDYVYFNCHVNYTACDCRISSCKGMEASWDAKPVKVLSLLKQQGQKLTTYRLAAVTFSNLLLNITFMLEREQFMFGR